MSPPLQKILFDANALKTFQASFCLDLAFTLTRSADDKSCIQPSPIDRSAGFGPVDDDEKASFMTLAVDYLAEAAVKFPPSTGPTAEAGPELLEAQ